MATRQPRRTRRRAAPASSLPRPVPAEEATTTRAARRSTGHRAHHITTDYRYVKKDLLTILGVGATCLAFIVGMALYLT